MPLTNTSCYSTIKNKLIVRRLTNLKLLSLDRFEDSGRIVARVSRVVKMIVSSAAVGSKIFAQYECEFGDSDFPTFPSSFHFG